MRTQLLSFFVSGLLFAAPALAERGVAIKQGLPGCGMQKQIGVNVNFNIKAATLMEAKAKFDEKIGQVETFAKQQGIQKFDLQSMNYNIYASQTDDDGDGVATKSYQLNGSSSYQLDSEESAFKIGEFLEKQKFQVNINANAYRQGNCG